MTSKPAVSALWQLQLRLADFLDELRRSKLLLQDAGISCSADRAILRVMISYALTIKRFL